MKIINQYVNVYYLTVDCIADRNIFADVVHTKYIIIMPKEINELAALKAKQADALAAVIKQFAIKLADCVKYLEGLDVAEIANVVSDKEVRPSIRKLGLTVKTVEEEPAKSPKSRKTGKRHTKASDEDILKYLAKEHSVGEIRKDLGQLVPKKLKRLEQKGQLVLRKDGIKKFWKVK